MTAPHHISVCICTFARPQLLARLLERLNTQLTDNLFTCSAVVIDNDVNQTARSVVEDARKASRLQIDYDVEEERSISLARNRSVHNARGDLIAFIDDDEFPAEDWLLKHFRLLVESKADGVLGPVLPHFDDGDGPAWLVRSGLLDRSRLKTGEVIRSPRHTRTGNVLLWRRVFDDGAFDPKYGKTGGGDAVFFKRKMEKGCVFVWCDDALVYETVPVERQKRGYYLRRACTRGMTEAWETPLLSLGTVRSIVAVGLYTCLLPILFFVGHHLFMRYLVSYCDHLAKLLAYLRIRLVHERPYHGAPRPSQAV